uniref:Secreted protein n=1 Tax=Culicoides sonorensis TaxID=179676 RepID=Q66U35_CULSO|nr:unknown salivary protein [Culicoides sonorensis]
MNFLAICSLILTVAPFFVNSIHIYRSYHQELCITECVSNECGDSKCYVSHNWANLCDRHAKGANMQYFTSLKNGSSPKCVTTCGKFTNHEENICWYELTNGKPGDKWDFCSSEDGKSVTGKPCNGPCKEKADNGPYECKIDAKRSELCSPAPKEL